MLDIGTKSAGNLRREFCGNFQRTAGMPPKGKSIFFSAYSIFRARSMPHTLAYPLLLLILCGVLSEGAYQSPAVYAIVGLIALECQDTQLLTQAVSRMEQFRCFDASSACNGAFASKLEEVSSFDQCMALVLYAQMGQG